MKYHYWEDEVFPHRVSICYSIWVCDEINLMEDFYLFIGLLHSGHGNESHAVSPDQYKELEESIARIRKYKIWSAITIGGERGKLRELRIIWYRINKSEIEKRRIKASTYTAKIRIKNKVFALHGKFCLKCGAKENISLDHVIPVSKKGKDSVDNLQPLCGSCNSRKGVNVTDYRKNKQMA